MGAGGGDDGGSRPSVSTSDDTVCDAVADVACFNMFQCCSEGEIEAALHVSDPRTESECRDDVRAICERQKATIDFSVKNNRVTFDAKVMNACLQAFVAPDDGTCATIAAMLPWAEPCLESAWTGTVGTGGQCDFQFECAQDNVCSNARICTALPTDGMACLSQTCASGLFCNTGTCRPQVAEGGTCTSTLQCQRGLFCDSTTLTRTCTKLHAVGEMCSGPATCASGSTCLPGTCAGSGFSCTSVASCSAHCEDDNSFCSDDSFCSTGTCSGTTTPCFSNTGCTTPATCEFPIKCLPAECVGEVCAEQHLAIDYCEAAIDGLPFFQGGLEQGGRTGAP
jgi:hypothetical protein